MSAIISALNKIVLDALHETAIPDDSRILIPSGDGLCIALLNVESPFDVHLRLALTILAHLATHDEITDDASRKFMLRVGISENTDNLVSDINGRPNIAGAGITSAQRVMAMADGNQIIMSQAVYETLRQREKYMRCLRGGSVPIKHGDTLRAYQLTVSDSPALNTDPPVAFSPKKKGRLPVETAHYIAQAISHRDALLKGKEIFSEHAGVVLLYFLAEDSAREAGATEYEEVRRYTVGAGKLSVSEQLEYYDKSVNGQVLLRLAHFVKNDLFDYRECFVSTSLSLTDYRFVSANGEERLKSEWPNVWKRISPYSESLAV